MIAAGYGGQRVLLALCLALGVSKTAEASGGCFGPRSSPVQVTGHRMAFAISERQTVLWAQFEFRGDPEDFSWVLPVRPGAYVELAEDAWLTALDRFTATTVIEPELVCADSDSGSCDCDGRVGGSAGRPPTASGGVSPGDVSVVRRQRVGPYESTLLRSEDPDALRAWLAERSYVIPREIEPVIDAYLREGNDFLAIRLQPSAGISQMEPVRIVTPGGDNVLPLRMAAAGAGSHVPITLFVIGEGRHALPDLTEVSIPDRDLSFDYVTQTSDYAALRESMLAKNSGRSTLVSFARSMPFASTNVHPKFLTPVTYPVQNVRSANRSAPDTILSLYLEQAATDDAIAPPACPIPPLNSPGLVRPSCASGQECEPIGAGELAAQAFECGAYDDLGLALGGLHPDKVWLTRFELNLPADALDADLLVEPLATATEVQPFVHAARLKNPPCSPPLFSAGLGSTVMLLVALGTLRARRRARSEAT
jgi:hypothetical protein